jgi:hypothetical protein
VTILAGYLKIITLIVMVGVIYWSDLLSLPNFFSFDLAISLFFLNFYLAVYIYQRKKVLKSFLNASKSNLPFGVILFAFFLVSFIIGSYTVYPLRIHAISLIFLVASFSALQLDYRIVKTLSLPFFILTVLLIPPLSLTILFLDFPVLIIAILIAILPVFLVKTTYKLKIVAVIFNALLFLILTNLKIILFPGFTLIIIALILGILFIYPKKFRKSLDLDDLYV